MEEILYELRDHSAGLNCGIWDYSASFVNKFGESQSLSAPEILKMSGFLWAFGPPPPSRSQRLNVEWFLLKSRCLVCLLQVTDKASCCLIVVNMWTWRSDFCSATWTYWFRRVIGGERRPQEEWQLYCCLRTHSANPTREWWPLLPGRNVLIQHDHEAKIPSVITSGVFNQSFLT